MLLSLPGLPTGWAQQANRSSSSTDTSIAAALKLEQQGKNVEAEAIWRTVLKTRPRDASAYAHLGLMEARQEHFPEAIASYRKARELNPAIPQLSLNLGLALFKAGDFQESALVFEEELRRDPKQPDTPRLTILTAMSNYGAKKYTAAIPYLKIATAADPRNLSLRLTLAHCYLWTKQFDPVLEVYKEILSINPESAEAYMIAGEALDEKGDSDGAVRQFRAAAQVNPREPNVHFGLGYLLWAQKKYEDAIPEFKAELENDPRNVQAMIYMGDTYIQQNDFDKAKIVLEGANRFQTTDPLIHLDLGIVYMDYGDKDKAIREFQKTVELEPDNVAAHFRLGKLYQSIGKRDEAKTEFTKASSLNKKTDQGLLDRITAAEARPAPAQQPATEMESYPKPH